MDPFTQLLQHFPLFEFAALVKRHGAQSAANGFTCRAQLVAVLLCQMPCADSLGDMYNGLVLAGELVRLVIDVARISPPWPAPITIGRWRCMKRCSTRRADCFAM